MTLKPLDDRVVVELMEAEEKTKGGIVLPDTAKEKPQKGKVVAVGPCPLTSRKAISCYSVNMRAMKSALMKKSIRFFVSRTFLESNRRSKCPSN